MKECEAKNDFELEDGPVFGGGGVVLQRSAFSLRERHRAQIDTWMARGAVKRWPSAEAQATGATVFQAHWVDDPTRLKSRYVIKHFANTKDLAVCAAASADSTSSLVDFKAATCGY